MILLLLIFIPVNRDEGGGFKFGRNGIILKKTKVDPVVESSEADVNKEPEPDVLPETSDQADIEKETDSEEISSDEPSDNFFIIAGSFQHLRNASDLHNVLTGKGYPSEVIITENRLYRVSVISYATKEEATIGLRGIKAEAGLENCWLLSN